MPFLNAKTPGPPFVKLTTCRISISLAHMNFLHQFAAAAEMRLTVLNGVQAHHLRHLEHFSKANRNDGPVNQNRFNAGAPLPPGM